MKRFLMTIALMCLLSASALAGEIPSGGFASPPPSAPGDVPSGGYAAPPAAPGDIPSGDVITTVVLTIIGLLPS